MTRPSPRPPCDEHLPGSDVLFDVDALRDLLGAGREAEVRLRYVEHEPGASAVVLVDVDAVTFAVSIGRITPVAAGLQIDRYPDDPGLPGLADGLPALLARLGVDRAGEPRRLAWVPHRRLVMSVGDVVVKLHASGDETVTAVEHARIAGTVVAVPDVVGVDVERAVHVQRRVAGRALGSDDAPASIPAAVELIERLHQLEPRGLVADTPAALLAQCRRVGDLVAFIAPHAAHRVANLLAALDATRPVGGAGVPSHGDFNVGQMLLRADGSMVLVDTDTLCIASPALDPASYAANLVAGRDGDLERARAVAAGLAVCGDLDGRELDWFLAAMVVRRLDRGFRRYKRNWPRRTELLLDAAETLVDAL